MAAEITHKGYLIELRDQQLFIDGWNYTSHFQNADFEGDPIAFAAQINISEEYSGPYRVNIYESLSRFFAYFKVEQRDALTTDKWQEIKALYPTTNRNMKFRLTLELETNPHGETMDALRNELLICGLQSNSNNLHMHTLQTIIPHAKQSHHQTITSPTTRRRVATFVPYPVNTVIQSWDALEADEQRDILNTIRDPNVFDDPSS
jgi:hypothetical protein